MKLKAVLTDFDGTLVDSVRYGAESVITAVKNLGHLVPKNIYDKFFNPKNGKWGRRPVEIIMHCFNLNQEQAEAVDNEWGRIDKFTNIPIIYGAIETLLCAKSLKLKLGILSNRDRQSLMEGLSYYNIADFFETDLIQGGNDWFFHKPNPYSFYLLLHKLSLSGITSDQVIFIGDTPDDFKAAQGMGIRNFSVLTGMHRKKENFLELGQKEENILDSIFNLPEKLLDNEGF
jgi:phosphoglycolate phosphatase